VSSQVGSIIPNDPTGANVTFTIEEHVALHSTSMEYQKDHSSPISLAREIFHYLRFFFLHEVGDFKIPGTREFDGECKVFRPRISSM
jgi:hypothetical protein